MMAPEKAREYGRAVGIALLFILIGVVAGQVPGCYADAKFLRTARLITEAQLAQQQATRAVVAPTPAAPTPNP